MYLYRVYWNRLCCSLHVVDLRVDLDMHLSTCSLPLRACMGAMIGECNLGRVPIRPRELRVLI